MIDLFKRTIDVAGEKANQSICVWGPAGSPGRSMLASNLACELALEGRNVLLIDLDTYSPGLADLFGLIDHPPGLAAAARLAGQDRLDLGQFERLAVKFTSGRGKLSILTGLGSSARWPEISAEKCERIIEKATGYFEFVIVDVASNLESSVRQIGGAVERNIVARTALASCSKTIAVFSADPIGTKRFIDSFELVAELASDSILVANRLRSSALGLKAKQQVQDAVMQFCRKEVAAFIPADFEALDKAVLESVPLAMMKRSSPARQAIAQFARLNFLAGETRKQARVAKLD